MANITEQNIIAVDAMGGDNAPDVVVEGALIAAKQGIRITLFGDEDRILSLLYSYNPDWRSLPITIIHCPYSIAMDEEPSKAVMRKKDSSLVSAMVAVKNNSAHAFVSAGNSGAVLAAGILFVGRAPGILRPALGSFLPTNSDSVFCLDLGANTDCKVEYLEQFALMGNAYVQLVKNIARPRVALLSNGHEPYKGSAVVKQAYDCLSKMPLYFIGNVEARDIFNDQADVLVCDGFVGNIMLKTAQGAMKAMVEWLKQAAATSWWHKLSLLCSMPLLKKLKEKTDYAKVGGAVLLGLAKPVIIAHGSSNSSAIAQAIILAHTLIKEKRIEKFNAILAQLLPGRLALEQQIEGGQ